MVYSLDWLKAPLIRNIAAKTTVTDLLLEAIFSSEVFFCVVQFLRWLISPEYP